MLRPHAAAAALLAILIAPQTARAEPPPPPAPPPAPRFQPNVRAALAVGALTMIVPGVIGGFRTAYGKSDGDKTAGLLLASGGFTLAPVFSHMVAREWARAAAFGAIPLATTIAATALVSQIPGAVYRGTTETRTAFGVLLGAGMLDAVLGLADTALAGERARAPRGAERAFLLLPAPVPGGAVLSLGGSL